MLKRAIALFFIVSAIVASVGLTAVTAQAPVKPALTVKAAGSAYSIGDNGGDIWAAQSFKGAKGILTELSVTLGESSGYPDGTITYQIRPDAKKLPGDEILAEGEFEPEASADNVVTVDDLPLLAPGETYWIVLMSTDPQYTKDYWTWQVATKDVYKGGRFLYSGDEGYSWNDDAIDAQFTVTVR